MTEGPTAAKDSHIRSGHCTYTYIVTTMRATTHWRHTPSHVLQQHGKELSGKSSDLSILVRWLPLRQLQDGPLAAQDRSQEANFCSSAAVSPGCSADSAAAKCFARTSVAPCSMQRSLMAVPPSVSLGTSRRPTEGVHADCHVQFPEVVSHTLRSSRSAARAASRHTPSSSAPADYAPLSLACRVTRSSGHRL